MFSLKEKLILVFACLLVALVVVSIIYIPLSKLAEPVIVDKAPVDFKYEDSKYQIAYLTEFSNNKEEIIWEEVDEITYYEIKDYLEKNNVV